MSQIRMTGNWSFLRLPLATLVVLIIVYIKDATWAWLNSTLFWIIAFVLMISTFVIFILLIRELVLAFKNQTKQPLHWVSLMLTIILLIFTIRGMR